MASLHKGEDEGKNNTETNFESTKPKNEQTIQYRWHWRINFINLATMPQLPKTIALPPLYIDAIDKETKYPVDTNSIHHHRTNAIIECTTAASVGIAATTIAAAVASNTDIDGSDTAANCDSFNTIEIKQETEDIDDVSIMPVLTDDMDLLSTCDIITTTTNNDDRAVGIKPTTNFLCHRCRKVFSTRDEFELHYK